MASILPMAAYLMQAAQGGGMDGPLIPPAPPGYPPNTRPLSMDMAPTAPSVAQEEVPVEEEIVAKGLDPIQHKGLFGVKGTLRDILGLLGDSYLLANGRNPYYAPIRREELLGSEMAGRYQNNEEENFINNPQLVAQRLAESGFGKEARGVYQDFTKNEEAKAAQEQDRAQLARQNARDDQLAKQGDVTAQKNFIDGVLTKLYAGVTDEASLAAANQWAAPKLDALGLTGYRLPGSVQAAKQFGIQPYQRERLEDFEEGLNIQQQNANSNSQRAATARPRADSKAEVIERIGNIPEEKRTPGQKAAFEAATRGPSGRGRRTGSGASASGGSPSAPPRKKGDAYRTSDGRIWRSPDGKTWQ